MKRKGILKTIKQKKKRALTPDEKFGKSEEGYVFFVFSFKIRQKPQKKSQTMCIVAYLPKIFLVT